MNDSTTPVTHGAAPRARRWTFAALAMVVVMVLGWWWLQRPEGKLVPVADFGANPTQLEMHLYLPPRIPPRPALVLALHWCKGSGPDFHANTDYARLADQHGFLVIYPSVTRESRCWDVHSHAAITADGGSDPQGLLSMVRYAVNHYGVDSTRMFVTGYSSGGMMTQLLLGAYPEVFRAGAVFAGVPFGCFAGPEEWNADCANGKISNPPEVWGNLVRHASPTFSGTRPALQLWHGTGDASLSFHNFGESIKQWTNVLEVSAVPASTERGLPHRDWTRFRYATSSGEVRLEAFRGEGIPHNFKIAAKEVIRFFGLED